MDFVGYVHYPNNTRIRKYIKENCRNKLRKNPKGRFISSYKGWFIHADCKNLSKKLFNNVTLSKI